MNKPDPFGERKLKQLELFIYLLPVVGFFPAAWRLYRNDTSREQRNISRLSVTLTLAWAIAYSLLWAGATQTSEFLTLRLLYLNSLLTCGYFLACIGAMVSLRQGKIPRLPGFGQITTMISNPSRFR